MNTLDILLVSGLCYLSGILTGLGLCVKYKRNLLIKTTSQENLSALVNSITNDIYGQNTGATVPIISSAQPHIIATAPPIEPVKEVVIRTN